MAFEEVVVDPNEIPQGASFFKFTAIGDRLAGVFLSAAISNTGKFGPKMQYRFRVRGPDGKPAEVVLEPPTHLAKQLEKADLKPGNKVIAEQVGELDVGKESPMKTFKLMVDRATAAPAAPKPPAPPPPPKPPAPPAPKAGDEFDDIPF